MRRLRRPLSLLVVIVASSGGALAHAGHATDSAHWTATTLPFALVVAGGVVAASSLYLEQVGTLEGKIATAGLLLGVGGFLAGVALGVLGGV